MDNLEKNIRDSKSVISSSNCNNPNEIYSKAMNNFVSANNKREKFKFFSQNLIVKYVISVLLVFAIVVSMIAIFKEDKTDIILGNENGDNLNISQSSSESIKKISSLSELENLILNSSANSSNESTDDEESEGATPGIGDTGVGDYEGDIDIDHSYNTNVQVSGVDEADIVKVNGDYIYYVTNGKSRTIKIDGEYKKLTYGQNCMYILKANGQDLDVIKEISLPSYDEVIAQNEEAVVTDIYTYTPRDVLYTDKYVVLSAKVNVYSKVTYNTSSYSSNYRNYTEFFIYDTKNYELVTKVNVPGYVQSTRLINNQLYIISNYYDYKSNNYNNLLPRYAIDDYYYEASLDNIYYCPGMGTNFNSYIVVFRLTLEEDIRIEDFYLLAPSINNIYMNHNAIYLIRTYTNKVEKEDNKVAIWPTSKVLSISTNGDMAFKGLVEVKGNISDRYWIDEYNGYLRIATTGTKSSYKLVDDKYQYDRKWEVFNYLTIFNYDEDGNWKKVSEITEGLGEVGETMKSARFNGNVATIVTFKQTDPLYYIDLTDPLNPVITSELKVSGFTVYQHPYKDNYVIGIGYEANENGRTTGYKVALFDITDKLNVKQVGDAIVFSDDEYFSPDVLYNPKELFLDLDNNIFGFSILQYKKEPVEGKSYYEYYYRDTFQLFKIDLDKDNPISIINYQFGEYNTSSYYCDYFDRMVFIKDKYYLMGAEEVHIYQLSSSGVTLTNKKELMK